MRAVARTVGKALLLLLGAALLIGFLGSPFPAPESGLGWFGRILLGDFGVAVSRSAPSGGLVLQSLTVTLPLLILAAVVAGGVGVGLAALVVRLRGRRATGYLSSVLRIVSVVPPLWLGLLLVLLFSTALHWLPTAGFFAWTDNFGGALASLILPILAIGLPFGAQLGLLLASKANDVLDGGQVRFLFLRGQAIAGDARRKVLRNILVNSLSAVRDLLPSLLAATWIVETSFYLPGLGRLIVDSVVAADPYLTRAALFAGAALAVGLVLIAELGQLWADPRTQGNAI